MMMEKVSTAPNVRNYLICKESITRSGDERLINKMFVLFFGVLVQVEVCSCLPNLLDCIAIGGRE